MDLNPDGSLISPPSNSFAPAILSLVDDWKPLCRRPKIASVDDATTRDSRSFEIAESTRHQIKEQYMRIHEEEIEFASEMGRLRIISPQNENIANAAEHTIPHRLITTLYTVMHEKIIRRLLNSAWTEKSIIVDGLNDFHVRLACANACTDVILLHALDACAILGGVVLPCWPPNVEWQGVVFNQKDIPSPGEESSTKAHRFLAIIRRFERWGVPIWNLAVSGTNSRLDVTPSGLPCRNNYDERSFQHRLQSLVSTTGTPSKLVKVTTRLHTNNVVAPACSGVPSGSERRRLQKAIIALLDHNSPHHMTFASFSAIAKDILGESIWAGRLHEALMHPQSFDTSHPMPWNRVRDALRECSHCGVNIALFQIPRPWVQGNTSVATAAGEYVSASHLLPSLNSLAATPRGVWFILEIDGLMVNDKETIGRLARRFAHDGVYGWAFAQSSMQLKTAEGKTIPRSRFTARVLVKQKHAREHFARAIATDFEASTQWTKDMTDVQNDFLNNFEYFAHPTFADVAYSEPITLAARSQVMHLAPPFDVFPSSSGSKDCAGQVKTAIHSLRHIELFEIGKFPPLIAPTSPVSIHPSTSSSVGLDMSLCTTEVLRQLASSACPNDDLSFMDVCRMQRFAYLMEVLAKEGGFVCRVFRSDGPYLKILRYLSSTIRARTPPGSSFMSRLNRQQISPYYEAIRLTPSGHVEIILNLDVPDSTIRLPTQAEFDQYNMKLEREGHDFAKKLSRSEVRQRKNQKRIAEGVAAALAGMYQSM
jgi:hypothetical protein